MRNSIFPTLFLGATLSTFSVSVVAATLVVNPNGGAFVTIQSAVDAASPGDTISIKPHPDPKGYRENVVINTPDLTLKGSGSAGASTFAQRCPKVVLDGCETPDNPDSCGASVLLVNEPDTRILSLTIRHGGIDLDSADRTSIEKICVIDGDNDAVATVEDVDSSDVVVKNSVFQGGRSESIAISGNNAQLLNNRLFPTDNGIRVNGDDAIVKGNRMTACNDNCIVINGTNGTVERNILDGGDDGINYYGDQPNIINNRIEYMYDDAIRVDCTGCTEGTISKNRIVGASDDDEGIAVTSANNILIERNTISNIDQNAIELFGNNSTIRNNKISRAGTESTFESCIEINGISNTTEKNKIRYCTFAGIRHNGDNGTHTGNTIIGSGRAGIEIEGGVDTLISNNTITSSQGEGIANTGGTNTDIENNKIKKSRIDICNDESIDSFTGNTFTTGGTATSCVVDS